MRDSLICKEVNTIIQVRDASGNIKKLFNWNKLGRLTGLRIPYVTGLYKDELTNHNLITNAGITMVAKLIGNISSPVNFTYIGLGTGTTAAAAADTALTTEITTGGLGRALATVASSTVTTTNDSASYTKTFTASSTFAVTEEGIFSAVSAGTMLAHQVFSAVSLNSGDSISITHVVTA